MHRNTVPGSDDKSLNQGNIASDHHFKTYPKPVHIETILQNRLNKRQVQPHTLHKKLTAQQLQPGIYVNTRK